MSETPTPPRRRWFQFSLSSLLWLMVVLAIAAFGVRERRERRQLEAEVCRQEAEYKKLEARYSKLFWENTMKPHGHQGGFNFETSDRDKTGPGIF
jgi:cell division protein FtsB